jgi:glycosyltransferase involved in cell wall biosynthesis
MRIAVISDVSGYPWAGSEELWLQMAIRALGAGHQVTACLHPDLHAGEPLSALVKAGGKLADWGRCRIARLEKIKQRIAPNFSLAKLGTPDVILVSAGSLPSLTYVPGLMEFLLSVRIPIVVLCQFNSDALGIAPEVRESLRNLLQQAAVAIFVSEQNKGLAKRQLALPLEDAKVVYNPIRVILSEPLPARSNQDEIVFACVARMETLWKGQDLLLEVLEKEPWASRKWKLRFFGEGPDQQHVRDWSELLCMQHRVTFEGYIRDVREIWSDSDLLVLASRGEGTPLAVLEAMMCGRPVVTTDVGGNREVLEDGMTGYIAAAATVNSFGRALERAWDARQRWPELGRAAHVRATEIAASDPAGLLLEHLQNATKPSY